MPASLSLMEPQSVAINREYHTFKRKLRILDLLPDQMVGSTSVGNLHERLRDEGYTIDRRGVERDLNELSRSFSLGKGRGRPAGWYWSRNTKPPQWLGMDVETALIYQLLERFIELLLPRVLWERLLPQFAQARTKLRTHSSARFAQWNRRVAVDPGTQPLLRPSLDAKVLRAVTSALLESQQLAFDYRKVGSERTGPRKRHRVTPYGLVLRGRALYLIAGLTTGIRSNKPLTFALHRMAAAQVMAGHASVPTNFDLERDVTATGSIGIRRGAPIRLKLHVTAWWADFLSESPLSINQTIAPIRGSDNLCVTATVPNTGQLRWWLMSLGQGVEVLTPKKLRDEVAAALSAAARQYERRGR